MVNTETIVDSFATFGITVADEAVLDKCLDICHTYNLTAEALVETWLAYSVSENHSETPTVEALGQMERKDLKIDSNSTPLRKSDKNLSQIATFNSSRQYADDENILGKYGCTTPTSSKTKRLRSPEEPIESLETKLRAVDSPFSPSCYTPKTKTPSRLAAQPNRGKTLVTFGVQPKSWKNVDTELVEIKKEADELMPVRPRYMYEKLTNKAEVLDSVCQLTGMQLIEQADAVGWKASGLFATDTTCQNLFKTFGRICCDSDGKLNNVSILLEGSKHMSGGKRMKLDFSRIPSFSLFPGQIVAVRGKNPTGKSLVVKKLHVEDIPPRLGPPKITHDMKIVVAAGPFTQPTDLKYEPLLELLEYIAENEPHVLILIGPFVEYDHPEVQKLSMSVTFDEFFEQCIENIMNRLQNTNTQVIVIASNREAHHEPIFPTPEYILQKKYPNLQFMPDPCMLDVNGLIIGTTSVDVVMHMSREEISRNLKNFDRLKRIATHILAQRCFYPLYPPPFDINIDIDLWRSYAFMDQHPHVLILPSNLRYFANSIYESLVVNPERVSKCSFARLNVRCPDERGWSPSTHIDCQVLRL